MDNYTRLRIKTAASFIIIMILVIAGAYMFREWIYTQQYLNENEFLKNAGGRYTEFITYLKGDDPSRNIASNYVIPFVLFFLTISTISIVTFTTLMLVRRLWRKISKSRKMARIDVIQDLILDYLFEPDSITFETLKGENKKLLIDQMVYLHEFIIGEKAEMLKKLFKELRLEKYVGRKIKALSWSKQMKYINVATAMDLVGLKPIVEKHVNSTNWHVRDAAQLASLRLDKKYSFDFLNKVDRRISEWQETQIYHLIVKESIPVDDFSKYLLSSNDSVAILSLKLMEDFDQNNHCEKIIKLLKHKNYHVKKQALKTIIGLNLKEAEKQIIEDYAEERLSIKILSMQALAQFNTPSAIEFIEKELPNSNFDINKSAIRYMTNETRGTVLSKIEWNEDIDTVVKQINNKQLV